MFLFFRVFKQSHRMYYLLSFLMLLPFSSALYFHIGETERKCFIEEIPDETMVTGNNALFVKKKKREK